MYDNQGGTMEGTNEMHETIPNLTKLKVIQALLTKSQWCVKSQPGLRVNSLFTLKGKSATENLARGVK